MIDLTAFAHERLECSKLCCTADAWFRYLDGEGVAMFVHDAEPLPPDLRTLSDDFIQE
ncbi:MAG: hypothetical protein J0I77_14030 [Rudaea sp.]|uniref:hypothetical protein n=1 Tax=Rudaea sp. TaxID=2136325 RepID=UPI0014854564|nr:hypothetical protein [Rudaea sp.]MBN8886834.1 hypothetical protein [Rudaea sp.]